MSAPESIPTVWRRHIVEAVPRLKMRRDAPLPAIVVVSVLVHAAALLAVLASQWHDEAKREREIPVEIVQLPPKPPEPPKQASKAAPKQERAQSQQEQAKQAQAKQEQAKQAQQAKQQQQASKEPSKPAPQKTAEAKRSKPPEKQAAKEPQRPKPAEKPAQKPSQPNETKQAAKEPQESPAERLKNLLGPIQGLAAAALPGSAEAGTEAVSYSQLVMSRIAKAKKQGRYPGVPGYATVGFQIGDHGEVTGVQMLRPSGDDDLDAEAMALVHRGEPYPPPPPGGRRDYVVTLQFRAMPD